MFASKIKLNDKYLSISGDKIITSSGGLLFTISIKNQRKVDGGFQYECYINHENHNLAFDKVDGLTISDKKSALTLYVQNQNILNRGEFTIGDGSGNFIKFETDLVTTANANEAAKFEFVWVGINNFKRILTVFLKARYYIDHKKIINNLDQANEVKQIYRDIGQIIIKIIAGDRRESIYYRDQSGHFMSKNKSMTPQERFDYTYAPSVLLDDYRHMYPPFAIPPSTLVDRFANDGVDYQRAATDESSNSAMELLARDDINSADLGILRQAEKMIYSMTPQVGAWERIRAAVDPVGQFDNIWPEGGQGPLSKPSNTSICLIVIDGDEIGVNLQFPIFSGALTQSDPLYIQGPNDTYTDDKSISGVCVKNYSDIHSDLSDEYDSDNGEKDTENFNNPLIDHMCPVGLGDTRISMVQLLMIILVIAIIYIAARPDKKTVNIAVPAPVIQ